jgi:hypothetical protein
MAKTIQRISGRIDVRADAAPVQWQAAKEVWRLYGRIRWQHCRTPARKARFLLRRALQPVVAFRDAVTGTRTYGAYVARVAGVTPVQQFLHQWAIGARYGHDWDVYYRYRLYRLRDVRSAGLFLSLEANVALREHLYATLGIDATRLSDKRRFYRTCMARKLPVAQTVADFENGELRWWEGTGEALPPCDLFSKEACNMKGRGAARWRWRGDGHYLDEEGASVGGHELLARLQALSLRSPYVLQVRLANHPDIGRIAPETLCTVRVVTYCPRPGAAPRHLASTFRMAGGPFPVDSFSQGGLASPVDEATGTLGPAVYKDLHQTAVDHVTHPAFGTSIEGSRLPMWNEVIELALAAHRAFPDFPSVGWDIGITPDGPVLVEGNYNWNVHPTQQAGQRAIGATDFFDSYLMQLGQGRSGGGASRRAV